MLTSSQRLCFFVPSPPPVSQKRPRSFAKVTIALLQVCALTPILPALPGSTAASVVTAGQSGFYVSSVCRDKTAAPAPHISPGHCPFAPEALLWPLWASLARPEPEGWSAFLRRTRKVLG